MWFGVVGRPVIDVVLHLDVCQFCGACGVGAVLDTAVRCAGLGLVGLAMGSACWLGEDVTGQFGAKGPLVGPGDL